MKVLPSGVESSVARIVTFDGDLQQAHAGEAITLVLKDEIDISRGDLLLDAGEASLPAVQSASRRRGVDGRTAADARARATTSKSPARRPAHASTTVPLPG